MSEMPLVWMIPFKFLPTVLFSVFYAWGGREHKWLRRFAGSGLFCLTVMIMAIFYGSFNFYMIPISAILIAGLCLGYGGDDFLDKFIRRLVYGLVIGIYGFLFCVCVSNFSLGVAQLFLAIAVSLYFGLTNPVSAVTEETIISTFSVILIPFSV